MSDKTHWKSLQNPKYIGSFEFQPGEEKTLTIKGVKKETVIGEGGRKDEEAVMHFAEPVKPMILNKTNSKMIEKLLKTPYVEDWAGHKITLYVDPNVRFGGEITSGLRVRGKLPAEDKPASIPCADCGEIIQAEGRFTAQQIIDATRHQFGRDLCRACATKAKEGAVNAQPT